MDAKHRKHIENSMDRLIEATNYNELTAACVTNGLLTQKMCEIIEKVDPICRAQVNQKVLERERHQRLFLKLTKRGPDAYLNLKTILVNLGRNTAVQVLNEAFDDENQYISLHPPKKNSRHNPAVTPQLRSNNLQLFSDGPCLSTRAQVCENNVDDLKEYTEEIKELEYVVEKSNKIHTDKIGVYPMKSKENRGVLLLVNIIDFKHEEKRRNGAEEDSQSLLYLYKKLDFKLFAYTNLTKKKFFDILKKLLASDVVRQTECFTMVLMSHGELHPVQKEMVEFSDGESVALDSIKEHFETHKCPNLANTPKVLILPFCRGDIPDKGYYPPLKITQTEGSGILPRKNKPALAHLLICFASARGFMAHRDPFDGSWYIQIFCKLMAANAHDTNFEDIIKLVNQEASGKRAENDGLQTGCTESVGFDKKLYLNPGFYENEIKEIQ